MAINEKTRVSLTIGAVGALLVGAVGGTWTAASYAAGIQRQLESISDDFDKFRQDRFTTAMASEQALRTAMANPGMKVPDPRNPGQFFFVEGKR